MKSIAKVIFLAAICLPMVAAASDGYQITGKSGIMYFVAIEPISLPSSRTTDLNNTPQK